MPIGMPGCFSISAGYGELKKLPEEVENEDILIRWMRFLGGKNREELERMAKTDMYIEEAYQDLN